MKIRIFLNIIFSFVVIFIAGFQPQTIVEVGMGFIASMMIVSLLVSTFGGDAEKQEKIQISAMIFMGVFLACSLMYLVLGNFSAVIMAVAAYKLVRRPKQKAATAALTA